MSQTKYLSQSSVQDFLSARKRSSTLIAIGVMLCIFSPITLLILISLTRLDILTSSIPSNLFPYLLEEPPINNITKNANIISNKTKDIPIAIANLLCF